MFGLLYLVCLPILRHFRPGLGAGSPFEFLIPVVNAFVSFLPSFLNPWFEAFKQGPERLLLGLLFVGLLSAYGSGLQGRIRDEMRAIWQTPNVAVTTYPVGAIYRLRTSGPYKAFYYWLTHWALPAVFALIIFAMLLAVLYCAVADLSRAYFAFIDVTGGRVCAASTVTNASTQAETRPFATKSLCTATGLKVKKGNTNELSLKTTDGWEDGYDWKQPDPRKAKGIETGPNGFGWDKATWPMTFGLPYRRLIASNWFATVIRIGDAGFGEIVLEWKPEDPCKCPAEPRYKATFKAARDGEVFVYVNDSVVSWLGFARFYDNNKGEAELTIALKP